MAADARQNYLPRPPLRLGWLSTGRGPGSRGLFGAVQSAIERGEVNARIAYVFCNRERGEAEGSDLFLDQVVAAGVPALTISFRRFRRERGDAPDWRAAYNRELLAQLHSAPVDVLVLAGFMLVLDASVVRAYPALNLHPAAPGGPVGTWQEVIWELIAARARETGVMVQLATDDLDRGPVVAYCHFPIHGGRFDSLWREVEDATMSELQQSHGEDHPLFRAIREEGVKREGCLLVAALRAVANDRIRLEAGRVLDAEGRPLPAGHDLSREIEALVRSVT